MLHRKYAHPAKPHRPSEQDKELDSLAKNQTITKVTESTELLNTLVVVKNQKQETQGVSWTLLYKGRDPACFCLSPPPLVYHPLHRHSHPCAWNSYTHLAGRQCLCVRSSKVVKGLVVAVVGGCQRKGLECRWPYPTAPLWAGNGCCPFSILSFQYFQFVASRLPKFLLPLVNKLIFTHVCVDFNGAVGDRNTGFDRYWFLRRLWYHLSSVLGPETCQWNVHVWCTTCLRTATLETNEGMKLNPPEVNTVMEMRPPQWW